MKRIVLVLAILTMVTGCGQSSPSAGEGEALFRRAYRVATINGNAVEKIVGFKKLDGQNFNEFGVQGHRMSYEATFECTSAKGFCISVSGPPGWQTCTKSVANGERYTKAGEIIFTRSEKGWSGKLKE